MGDWLWSRGNIDDSGGGTFVFGTDDADLRGVVG